MEWFWAWSGKCFGYKSEDNLWTHDGRHVGRFFGDEVYSKSGQYLGEVKSGNRLITHCGKKNYRKSTFLPYGNIVRYVKYVDYVGNVMYVGYEDFPAPEDCR